MDHLKINGYGEKENFNNGYIQGQLSRGPPHSGVGIAKKQTNKKN